jgi:sodium/potassium-transporting ATPase subunit alpha
MSKNMKGKESLSDKIAGANVAEWKDHKLTPLAFFLSFSKIFEIPEEVDRTYGGLLDKADISKKVAEYTEDNPEYQKLEKHEKEHLKTSGIKLQERYLSFGLTGGEVEKRKERYGPNTMPEKKKHHWIFDLIHELTSVFALLLWVGGILAVIGYGLNTEDTSNLWLGIVLWIVVLVTGIFAFWQNSKSDDIIESFKSFQNAKAMVVRHGEKVEVNVKDLVLGDVVTFKTGDKVPADIRVFEANALAVNNSGLTGESEPVKITGECGEKGYDTPLEAKNIAFFSTLCVSGTAKGVVIRTGAETYMGKIADLSQSAETQALSLELEINRFIKIICIIAISLGVGFFFGSIGIGFPLIASFAFAIGIIVANVPEGLLSCLTVTLALTAYKLYKKNVMVKNMGSIETLGAVTCICSDKTGTLTQNRMSVVHLWYDCELKKTFEDQQDIVVDSKEIKLRLFDHEEPTFKTLQFSAVCGSVSDFKKETPDDYAPLVQARNAWVSNNKGVSDNQITEKVFELKKVYQAEYDKFYKSNIDERPTDGDASEAGIIKFFEKVDPIENTRKKYPQHSVNGEDIKIPFSSKTKCAGALRLVQDENDSSDANYLLAFKGAPDYLIKFCTHYMLNGKEYPKDNFFENKFQEANQAFALKGERVLGVAYYRFNKKDYPSNFEFKNDIGNGTDENKIPNYPTNKLCFVGLIAMEDPPREGVKEAITLCKRAGIKVIMVTGDQTLTAASIAYQIGIIEDLDDTPEVIQAKEGLATLEDAEKKSNVRKI